MKDKTNKEKTLKLSYDKPPIWEEANALFKLEELNMGTIFTFGDTLYNPFQVRMTGDLFVHERTHAEQHQWDGTVAGLWWKRYLADPEFRLEQEIEAYANQYKYIAHNEKSRDKVFENLLFFAKSLGGPMYGNIISPTEAMARIKEKAKT